MSIVIIMYIIEKIIRRDENLANQEQFILLITDVTLAISVLTDDLLAFH